MSGRLEPDLGLSSSPATNSWLKKYKLVWKYTVLCTLELMASRIFSQDDQNPFGAGSWHTKQWGALPDNQKPFCDQTMKKENSYITLSRAFFLPNIKVILTYSLVTMRSTCWVQCSLQIGSKAQKTLQKSEQSRPQCFTQSMAARRNKQSKDRWTQQLPCSTRTSDLIQWKKFRFIAFWLSQHTPVVNSYLSSFAPE